MLLLPGLVVFSGSVFVAAHEAYFAQAHKTRVFATVLEEFALRESAENRMDKVQAQMAVLKSLVPVTIKSAEELSRSDRQLRMIQLVKYLEETKSPAMQKKILATLLLFRAQVAQDQRRERTVLDVASGLAGQSFSRSGEFFDWLSPRLGTEGWEPVPLYRFEPQPAQKW